MREKGRSRGFTLIELLVVVLIIGILSATAIPQYFKLVEKSKIAEAKDFLNAVTSAQQRYQSKYGVYCTASFASCSGFDLNVPTMKYFATPTTFAAGTAFPSWKASLTRNQNVAVYGQYVITFDVESGGVPLVTCSQTNCSSELLK
jgi:prepilin-type N-terminal cleavage/methylation domain-containing protein